MRDLTLYEDEDGLLWNGSAYKSMRLVPAAVGVTVAEIEKLRQERDRYREALERIAAFHHAPGKTYKAAWVESVRMAREVLGMAQGAASSPDPMRDGPDSERDDAREEAREWARQFNRRRAREALGGGDVS